jgi:organic hydroperoxide reductase OsmC/OhrA
VAEPRARVFEYSASMGPEGRIGALGEATTVPESWAPEHLVLAGLVDCSLTSLRYHAKRVGVEVTAGSGEASGSVTQRESDGRFAFVEIRCTLDVAFSRKPDDLDGLLAKAERDCFVGASLTAKPVYTWNVA